MKKVLLIIMLFCLKMQGQPATSNEFVGSDPQITVYMVAQGYTTGTISDFETFVDGFLTTLWATEPYQTYQQKFKVVKVYDYATTDTYPRSFNQFNPPYTCSGGSASGAEDYDTFTTRMDGIATSLSADDHCYFLAVFNNDYYTGGGGKYTFVTDYCGSSYMYSVAIHEFSHSFALLGDEYGPQAGQSVTPSDFALFFDRNVTTATTLSDIPWNFLIPSGTPIPTCIYTSPATACSYTVPGLYEEANYAHEDWYRPQNTCKMRSVYDPFCANCQEIIKETIIKHLCPSGPTITESFDLRHQGIVHWRKSSNTLTSTSTVGNKIKLDFLATNTVVLTNGFTAKNGSDFYAYTGDCSYIDIRNIYRLTHRSAADPALAHFAEEAGFKNELVISPNPASDIITATVRSNAIRSIEIISSDGKKVYENTFYKNDTSISVPISNYQNGIYVVKIVTSKQETLSGKFVKG